MASYFTLILDTVGPEIEIYLPSYVLSSSDLDIVIQASEQLEPSFQEFTLIDSLGQHHPFILSYFDNYFKGKIPLGNIPLGIVTIVVQVRDMVLNLSPVVSKTVAIVKGAKVKIDSSSVSQYIHAKAVSRDILYSTVSQTVLSSVVKRDVVTTSKSREVRAVVR